MSKILLRAAILTQLVAFTVAIPVCSFAESVKIREYEDRIVVEYEGRPEPPQSAPSNKSESAETKKLERELRELREYGERIQSELHKKFSSEDGNMRPAVRNKRDDIKVCCISAMETERAYNYITYSVKADVDNRGAGGQVFIKLVAKNRDGHQIDFVYLKGFLDNRETRTLTTTTMMTYQQGMDARTWEVDSVNIY